MARILGIGIATLDIVNLVDRYPAEDEELRAYDQQIRRGGNVTNSLVVLSQRGHQCSWGGVLAADANSAVILQDLNRYGIDVSACRRVHDGVTPASYIALSRSSGSRTIVHYRDLPEFAFADFQALESAAFDWIHFEGRNVYQTECMLQWLEACGFDRRRVSVEIEKPRDGIEALLRYPGVLLLSRSFASARGFPSAEAMLEWARAHAPDATLVCAWGAEGAWYQDGSERSHVPGVAVPRLVDTLGAGDTFNAGIIDARLAGLPWTEALARANALAARKCGQLGFAGLNDRL